MKFAFAAGLSLLAVGCTTTTTTKTASTRGGSYTAARHNTVGSHIPQPSSIDDANNRGMTDSELERAGRNSELTSLRSSGGGNR